MSTFAPTTTDERESLIGYLALQHDAFRNAAYGLTDEQARLTPTPSTLSIAKLIKHVTGAQEHWIDRVKAAPEAPAGDARPLAERAADYAKEWEVDGDGLAGLLAAFDTGCAHAIEVLAMTDLNTAVPVPEAPWFPSDRDSFNARWVAGHLIQELARHAGHADIIREAIDGATMFELMAGREGWPASEWLTPWQPPSA